MIFSLNEKFLSNVKNKLTIESHLYLSNEKKIILNHQGQNIEEAVITVVKTIGHWGLLLTISQKVQKQKALPIDVTFW